MKGSLKFGLIVVAILMLVIAIVDMTSKKPIIWDRTYSMVDKNPFGMFVTRQELPHMLDHPVHIEEIDEDLFSYLRAKDTATASDEQYLFLEREYDFSNAANQLLLKRVQAGAKVFIAAEIFPNSLLDTLSVNFNYFYGYQDSIQIDDFLKVELTQDHQAIAFDKSDLNYSFTKLPKSARILGGIRYKDHLLPNFIAVKYGQGTVFLHLKPELFANYYLLNNNKQYQYTARAFNYLDGGIINWYNFDKQVHQSQKPLRVILEHKGLRQAWYLLLVSLILFLIYKSKREQRAVKTILPEPNLSKEFCETIGTLYYENGTPGNMLQKKIDYFLHDIRKKFHLDTFLIHEDDFVQDLSIRSAVDIDVCRVLVELIIQGQKARQVTENDLHTINSKIEEFKLKAKM